MAKIGPLRTDFLLDSGDVAVMDNMMMVIIMVLIMIRGLIHEENLQQFLS